MTATLEPVKVCRICHKLKPLSQYHTHQKTRDGRRGECRTCTNERNREKERLARQAIRDQENLGWTEVGKVCDDMMRSLTVFTRGDIVKYVRTSKVGQGDHDVVRFSWAFDPEGKKVKTMAEALKMAGR